MNEWSNNIDARELTRFYSVLYVRARATVRSIEWSCTPRILMTVPFNVVRGSKRVSIHIRIWHDCRFWLTDLFGSPLGNGWCQFSLSKTSENRKYVKWRILDVSPGQISEALRARLRSSDFKKSTIQKIIVLSNGCQKISDQMRIRSTINSTLFDLLVVIVEVGLRKVFLLL